MHGADVVNKRAYETRAKQLDQADDCTPSPEAVLDRLVKHRVSDGVDGSPQFFKAGKRKFDTMVRQLGLPAYFVTITMNETGPTRSKEFDAIDQLMQEWNIEFDWRDVPVECNCLFVARFKHILHSHLLKPLGTITDYAIRFECRGRGSLHVHTCVWLQGDVDALGKRLVSYIPAVFNPDSVPTRFTTAPRSSRVVRRTGRSPSKPPVLSCDPKTTTLLPKQNSMQQRLSEGERYMQT